MQQILGNVKSHSKLEKPSTVKSTLTHEGDKPTFLMITRLHILYIKKYLLNSSLYSSVRFFRIKTQISQKVINL